MSDDRRIHYLDGLRAAAMIGGVFLHAAMAYGVVTREVWLASDIHASSVFDHVFLFLHLFRMPLFFLMAGFFAAFLVARRGVAAFLKNRLVRIALPFVLFLPLVLLFLAFAMRLAVEHLEYQGPVLRMVADLMTTRGDEFGGANTAYLWFLVYLAYFSLLAVGLRSPGQVWPTRVAAVFFGSGRHLLYAPLVLVPALLAAGVHLPAPSDFTPRFWPFGYYGLFFLAGWHLLQHHSRVDRIGDHLGKLTLFCGAAYVALVHLQPEPSLEAFLDPERHVPPLEIRLSVAVLQAFLTVYLVLIALYLGKRFLNGPSRVLRYISDAAYWIYLAHLPLVLSFQYLLTDVDLNPGIKYAAITLSTLAVTLATYEAFVRYTPIGTMLNGKKVRA